MKLHIQTGGFALIPLMIVVALFVGVGAGVVVTNIKTNNSDTEPASQVVDTEHEVSDEVTTESAEGVSVGANTGVEIEAATALNVSVPAPVVSNPKIFEPKQISATSDFAIQNISATADEEDVSISWSTTIASDSRLILHNGDTEKIFVSKDDSSTEHSVYIDALEPSTEYSYEIIASADGKEVSKFSSVQTTRVYTLRTEQYVKTSSVDDECIILVLEDTQGRPLKNTQVTISGSSTNFAIGAKSHTTDDDGEIKFCQKAIELKVVVPSIGYTFRSSGLSNWTVIRPKD